MSFISTRGSTYVTASQAILQGIAPDGGLYVPVMFPAISHAKLIELAAMSYRGRASAILRKLLEDYSIEEIDQAIEAAYADAKFDDPAIAPTRQLDSNTYVLELYHGPTLAFKDMALQLLPHLVTLAGKKNGEMREISILTATSGDTGKAALEGFRDVVGTSCTVFYPLDGVSDIQRLQMVTTGGNNTHVIAVEGNFDDAQTGVKQLFASKEFAQQMDSQGKVLSSANSINFGRLAPQIVYYFSAYCDLMNTGAIVAGEPVNFVVPTGNFGNILAAYYAKQMGLPVGKLICASNRNNVLTDFFATGEYSVNRPFHKTTSPSMDILVSSNLERLLFELAGRDSSVVIHWMAELKEHGLYFIGTDKQKQLCEAFAAGYATDDQATEEIRLRFEQNQYLMDTHTAVASHVLRQYRETCSDSTPTVIVSTANPYKFITDVLTAVTGSVCDDDAFAASTKLHEITGFPIPEQVTALKNLPILHTQRCQKVDMGEAVLTAFRKEETK